MFLQVLLHQEFQSLGVIHCLVYSCPIPHLLSPFLSHRTQQVMSLIQGHLVPLFLGTVTLLVCLKFLQPLWDTLPNCPCITIHLETYTVVHQVVVLPQGIVEAHLVGASLLVG